MRQREGKVSNLMFPSPITGSYRDPRAVTNRLHRIQNRAGIPRIRFHDLRHSFATLSLEQGMDIKTVSHMLGHTDAGFTMNTYMHVTDQMQKAVADTMGKLIKDSEAQDDKIIKLNAWLTERLLE
jgi:integrase